MIRSIAGSIARPLAVAITGASGGVAPAPVDAYAANSFSPDYVADFSATSADYFRVAGSDSDFATAFTSDSEGGGLATQVDSSGNLVWRAHNLWDNSKNLASWVQTLNNASVSSNTTVAPDGETTADELVEIPPTGIHTAIRLDFNPASSTTPYYCAVAVKRGSGSRHAQLRIGGQGTGVAWVTADLDAGDVGNSGGSDLISASVTAVGAYFLIEAVWTYPSGGSSEGAELVICENGNDAERPSYAGDGSSSIVFWGMQLSRYDLGGMADVPADQRVLPALNKHVPTTTTAARYLARRRHHRWDGSAWVPTCLHEPVGATNEVRASRKVTGAGWTTSGTPITTQDQIGIDGVANTAWSIEDDNATSTEIVRINTLSCPDDSNPGVWSCFIKKDSSPSVYPAFGGAFTGGSPNIVSRVVFDPSDGTYVTAGPDAAPTAVYVEDKNEYWRLSVVITNNGAGNTTGFLYCHPAWNTDGSATLDGSATGTTVFDQFDVVFGQALPSSPIITNGTALPRTADTLKGKAASLPYSATAISMAVKGRHSFADNNSSNESSIFNWFQDSNDRIVAFIDSDRGTGGVSALVGDSSSLVILESGGSALAPGISVPVSVAVRFGNANSQLALDGVSTSTAPNNGTAPNLFDDDFVLGTTSAQESISTVDTIRLWDEDIAEAGIKEATRPIATGGTVTDSGGYRYHTFTGDGTLTVTQGGTVEYLVVAGGGGGAGRKGGGGGAGGYIAGSTTVTAQAYSITVGAGGAGGDGSTTAAAQGSDGSNSAFGAIASATGGGGGGRSGTAGNAGGSGGGGGRGAGASSGGASDAGGNDGGDSTANSAQGAGGGGGAGGVGQTATTADSGDGGAGSSWLDGTTYAGGGGGGGATTVITGAAGVGGAGGGGNGIAGGAGVGGTANTGGGGGGGGFTNPTGYAGGAGGSGIVIVRYAI